MRLVVSDTTPVNYLLLIDQIELLPRLFNRVHIPDAVRDELTDTGASVVVRNWIADPPTWLVIDPTPQHMTSAPNLDAGELAVIALASQLSARLLLIDERAATIVARAQGHTVMGTLGILGLAAERQMVDLRTALGRLTETNFRIAPRLVDELLARHANRT